MIIHEAKCPGCGHVAISDKPVEGQQIRIVCQNCETPFTLIDHEIEQKATEEYFRLAKDHDESSGVI